MGRLFTSRLRQTIWQRPHVSNHQPLPRAGASHIQLARIVADDFLALFIGQPNALLHLIQIMNAHQEDYRAFQPCGRVQRADPYLVLRIITTEINGRFDALRARRFLPQCPVYPGNDRGTPLAAGMDDQDVLPWVLL